MIFLYFFCRFDYRGEGLRTIYLYERKICKNMGSQEMAQDLALIRFCREKVYLLRRRLL